METAEPGVRQNGHSSVHTSDTHHPPTTHQSYPDNREPSHHNRPAMATATILQPSTNYPQSSYSSSTYPRPPSNMMSSSDSRNHEDGDASKRQSLPSISEVISGAKSYPPPPTSSSLQPTSSFPSPFTSAPPRPYPSETEKHTSPTSLRPPSSYMPRQELPSSFPDPGRPPFNGRPTLPPVSDRRPSPPAKHEPLPPHRLPDIHKDNRTSNGPYPPQQHPHAPPPSGPYHPGPLPRGQMPLPSYPISPRHAPSPGYGGQYEQRGHSRAMEDSDRGAHRMNDYNSFFEAGHYQEALGRLGQASRTTFNFAEAYARLAHEQHGAHHIPERLPSEQEVADMIANYELIRQSLDYLRDVVQQSNMRERAREGAKAKAYDDEEDSPMYGEAVKPAYAMTEVKKRRGKRAAPPGRCHSCNRVDTPEWRRGPDGARTLCNACGLHYAKLERKRQIEARSLRPKPEEMV